MAEKAIKRMNFFDGQFLKEEEFQDEQYYHLHMRRRLNYILFEESGVISINADDLTFINIDKSNKTFRVKAGMALGRKDVDMECKEIILRQDSPILNLNDYGITSGQTAHVTIYYEEEAAKDPPSEGDINKETRVKEKAVINVDSSKPTGPAPNGEEYILLGALDFDSMTEDYSDRQEAKIRASLLGVGPVTLVSIAITPASPTIQVGNTVQLTATGTRSDNNTIDLTNVVTWSSDNTSVAIVNASGLVTGVAAGSATITAESEGISGTATVTVQVSTPAPVFLTGINGTSGTQFDPHGGVQGTDVSIYGRNFSVDMPTLPSVELIKAGTAVHVFDVLNVTQHKSPGGISYEVIEAKVQVVTSEDVGNIRVTTSVGYKDSDEIFALTII